MNRSTFSPRKTIVRVGAIVLVAALATDGCQSASPGGGVGTPPPSAKSPAPMVDGPVLHMKDAVPLSDLDAAGNQVDLISKLLPPMTAKATYFGTSTDNDDHVTPIIIQRSDGTLRALSVVDPRLKNGAWSFIAAGPARGEIWSVLDGSDESGTDLILIHSVDAGATWQISGMHKVCPQADYDQFAMSRSGRGRLTLYLAGDCGEGAKAGFYHYSTHDAGKHWDGLEYEPDNLTPAQDVPEEEQLGKGKNAMWHGRAGNAMLLGKGVGE